MTALTDNRAQITPSTLRRRQFTLAVGYHAYHGGTAAVLRGTINVVPATGAANQIPIGKFTEEVDATSVAKLVTVELPEEITLTPFVNGATADAIAATDLLSMVYALDDQTATIVPNDCPLGPFWGFDGSSRALVHFQAGALASARSVQIGGLAAPVTGNIAVAASDIISGAVYLLPSLATNTTVTLATATVADGTQITIVADGTQGAFTTTYRYGTTAISAALTASKGHTAVLTKYGALWMANTTIAP
jgi:hypothetical protein